MKKLVIAFVLIAGLTYASVLDSNDLKIVNMQGLGNNPAAIAVTKKASVEVGTAVMSKLSHNSKMLSMQAGFSGSNKNPESFSDAPKFLNYTAVFGGNNWFAVKYYYDSKVYPYANLKSDANSKLSFSTFKKDATESLALILAKELAKTWYVGAELALNTYTTEDKTDANKDLAATGLVTDINLFSVSKPYYSLNLGLIKELNANTKVTVAHKISQDRGMYVRDGVNGYTVTDKVPNETSVGLVYALNDKLELGAYHKQWWQIGYDVVKSGAGSDEENKVTKYAYTNDTLVADYMISKAIRLQGYYAYLRNYKKQELNGTLDRGWKIGQLGGNVQYMLNNNGTILLGAYNTKMVSEDNEPGTYIIDQTVTHLSYSHAL